MEFIPKRKEGYTVVQLQSGELALANMNENVIIKVDPIVIAIWLAVDGKRNIDEITQKIIEDYEISEDDIPYENLKSDIRAIIDLMVKEGILEY